MERPAVVVEAPAPVAQVADYRGLAEPLASLRALWQAEAMQLWAEAVAVRGYPSRDRCEMEPGATLVVWTPPPGPRVWEDALRRVKPERVYLFAVDPGLDTLDAFLRRLVGLVKHALSAYNGRLEWEALAAATGHRPETVRAGLQWLVASGSLSFVSKDAAAVVVKRGGRQDREASAAAQRELQELLRETSAYREHFRQADARLLLVKR